MQPSKTLPVTISLPSLCQWLSAVVFCITALHTAASQPHWKNQQAYKLFAQGESLKQVLKNFAANYDVPVVISDNISESVNGQFDSSNPQDFLQKMAKMYGLSWYYDGSVLYIIRSDENQNRIIKLNHVSARQLKSSLIRLHIWDKQYQWRELSEQGLIFVSGPPQMIELVAQTAALMDQQLKYSQEEIYTIKVFALKHATAYDRTLVFRQREITVPGVATTLKQLIAGHSNNNTQLNRHQHNNKHTPKKGLAASASTKDLNSSGKTTLRQSLTEQQDQTNTASAQSKTTTPATIEADMRTNSVVVYDTQARMPLYEQLIKELDHRVDQIEINVSIVNIRSSNLKDLGIDWRATNNHHGSIGFGDITATQAGPDTDNIALAIGESVSFSTILSSNASYFLARINAMSEEGNAQILSRPSIISSNNMEAILDNSSTFFVRVAGREEVELFPVSVGSVLRVTPHIVAADNSSTIRLEVAIEDGQQTQERVDGIPVVQNSTISTTATVAENQSLLIGGYYYDTANETIKKVPVLHRLPLMGSLFKRSQNTVVNMARLFLITPRIVTHELDTAALTSDKTKQHFVRQIAVNNEQQSLSLLNALNQSGYVTNIVKRDNHYLINIGRYNDCQHLEQALNSLPQSVLSLVKVVHRCIAVKDDTLQHHTPLNGARHG